MCAHGIRLRNCSARNHQSPVIFSNNKVRDVLYYDVKFHDRDFLVFGRETKGLPESLLAKNIDNCLNHPDARDAQPKPRDRGCNCAVRSGATTSAEEQ